MSGSIVSGERNVSTDALFERAIKAARGFKSVGVSEGDTVALLLRNDLAFFETTWAAGHIGAFTVPINWHLTGPEIAYILEDCGAKILIAHADLLRKVEKDLPTNLSVITVKTPEEIASAYNVSATANAVQGVEWNSWVDNFDATPFPATEVKGAVFYTSGTTGKPKGVRRASPTPEQAEGIGQIFNRLYAPSPEVRTLVTGPMYHNGPYTWGMIMAQSGAEVILAPRFDAEGLLETIETHKLTHLFLVPTMFVWLLKLPEAVRMKYDLSSLKHIVHAAAPCSADIKRKMIEWVGPIINEFYGSTETGAVTFCDSQQWLEHPGTVGCHMPDTEVKIIGDDGSVLKAGEIGNIYVRNNNVTDFTYIGDDAKRQSAELDGLVTAGDMGYLDEDGFLFICDRQSDMVISGGVNIYPAEIESCLVNLEGVNDCAVFGIPDDEYGEAIAAVVELKAESSLDAQQIKDYVASNLAKFKVPRHVEFSTNLPREDSGKIMKRKLRDAFWQRAGRTI